MKTAETPKSASRYPLDLWRDILTGRVNGDGQCEWCGLRLPFAHARWFADEQGYILECSASCKG